MWIPDLSSFQLVSDFSLYLTILGIGGLICLAFAYLAQSGITGPVKAAGLAVTEMLLGTGLGLLCARGLYYLVRMEYLAKLGGTWQFFSFRNPEELCFFGGVAGVILSVVISAWVFRLSPRETLNSFAPAGALMIALVRFAEYCLQSEMLGLGMPGNIGLAEETVLAFPWGIAINWFGDGSYMEYHLAVFMYEGFVALAAMLFALVRRKDRDCFIRTLFYICLAQVLLESIRETSVAWLFVKAEQLLCFLYVEGVLVFYAVRRFRQRKWYGIVPPLLGLLAAGTVVMIEFELQNKHYKIEDFFAKFGLQNMIAFMKEMTPWMMYIIMAASLAVLGIADVAHHMIGKRLEKQAALR